MEKQTTRDANRAFTALREDHDAVKKLFARFERADGVSETKAIVTEACAALKAHAVVEEELFYPALRQKMADADGLIDEADEEHHEAKILVAELELMNGSEENFRAKFEVLAENIKHHIKEEESEIFPKARRTTIDFDALGQQMLARKRELRATGVEPDAETLMVGAFGVIKQSPSRRAQKTLIPPLRERKH